MAVLVSKDAPDFNALLVNNWFPGCGRFPAYSSFVRG
jgi:hypothetical protein